jgi:hypothetical protein
MQQAYHGFFTTAQRQKDRDRGIHTALPCATVAGMAGRYDPASRFKGVDPSRFASRAMTPQEKEKDKTADWMRFAGDIAPTAGSVLGGIGGGLVGGLAGLPLGPAGALVGGAGGAMLGTGIGAQVGGGLGQAVGAGFTAGADAQNADYEDEEANKAQSRDTMLATLMGLRR